MKKFSEKLLMWYDENPRNLPWKNDQDVYSIWISEIIMQQTRVSYGVQYYLDFKNRFPTVESLVKAPLEEVMKQWEGLGYYSRARNLHYTAKYVVNELDGIFPKTYEGLLKLKGVGPYTAAAIASFAYNEPIAAIDGNAYRVMARCFGIKDAIDSTTGKRKFSALGNQLIQKVSQRSGDFNQAMMNFGATVCKPKGPSCIYCVMSDSCFAFQEKEVPLLPVKNKKLTVKKRHFHFFVFQYENQVLIQERKEKDVWKNLYQFPMVEGTEQSGWEHSLARLNIDQDQMVIQKVASEQQRLTHQLINGQIVYIKLLQKPNHLNVGSWVYKKEVQNHPFPKLLQNAVKSLT